MKFDIKGAFDNLAHTLILKALRHHTDCKWILLYIERWLTAPLQYEEGSVEARTKGTAQGGVVSPVLLNLVLHYVFDRWMQHPYPQHPFESYADDGLAHCQTEAEACTLKAALVARFAECGLELHPNKTRIVYCKDGSPQTVRLFAASSVPIKRHAKLTGAANPFDPAWEVYCEQRLGVAMADDLKGDTNCCTGGESKAVFVRSVISRLRT